MIDDQLTMGERAELHASLDCALDDSDEDEWWRAHRDAQELFVEEFTRTLEQLSAVPGLGQRLPVDPLPELTSDHL